MNLGKKLFSRPIIKVSKKFSYSFLTRNKFVRISDEVQSALIENRAVIALESTVITHGLPYPTNFETALEMENIIREKDCIPATIGVFQGFLTVGLSHAEIEQFASAKDAVKVSRRDLAATLASKKIGGTTVSTTMLAAKMAGIRIFATGGIGGVHRGASETWDVSSDLEQLGSTRVAVVCAGVKSVLDIGKTLEYLETKGVPVVTFGPSRNFPGFFVANSGFESRYATEDANNIAQLLEISDRLDLPQGEVIACPIPNEVESSGQEIEKAIKFALDEAKEASIRSQDVTPYLLKRVNELTEGKSLKANVALLKNNAKIAATISQCYAEKIKPTASATNLSKITIGNSAQKEDSVTPKTTKIVVIGASIVDFYIKSKQKIQTDGSTYPGEVIQECGGVGRNHADALTRLGNNVHLISAVGDDAHGDYVKDYCKHMDLSCMKTIPDQHSSVYAALVCKDELMYGIQHSDMHACITPSMVWHESVAEKHHKYVCLLTMMLVKIMEHEGDIAGSKMAILDGNFSVETLQAACDMCHALGVPVWFDPATTSKVQKIFQATSWNKLFAISPNWTEFQQLLKCLNIPDSFPEDDLDIPFDTHSRFGCMIRSIFWSRNLQFLLVSRGSNGTLVFSKEGPDSIRCFSVPNPKYEKLVCVSGAGDCFNSGFIHGYLNSWPIQKSLALANQCAGLSLDSPSPVPPTLSGALQWNGLQNTSSTEFCLSL